MKVELKEKEATLAVAQEKSGKLLQEITASTAKAEKKKAEVQGVKDALAVEADGHRRGQGGRRGGPDGGGGRRSTARASARAITPRTSACSRRSRSRPS